MKKSIFVIGATVSTGCAVALVWHEVQFVMEVLGL